MTLRVAIITYQGYDGAGILHAHEFGNALVDLGNEVLLLLCGSKDTQSLLAHPPRYRCLPVEFENGILDTRVLDSIVEFQPQIVHLWTPRNLPARVGIEVFTATDARVVIHYEDDEEYILSRIASNQDFSTDDLAVYDFFRQDTYLPGDLARISKTLDPGFLRQSLMDPYSWPWIHPVVTPVIEKLASAVTSISPTYGRYLDTKFNVPLRTLYPGVEFDRFVAGATNESLRQELGLSGKTVLLYSGSIASFHDFTTFVEGFSKISESFPEAVIAQVGNNYIPEVTGPLLENLGLTDRVHFLGAVGHADMPRYLALGDVFLGVIDLGEFNARRLPSKIPEYMAMGKPIILNDLGVAHELEDGTEVIKLAGDSVEDVANGFRRAFGLEPCWAEMGARLREKATVLFDWQRNTQGLVSLYHEVLSERDERPPEGLIDEGDVGLAFTRGRPARPTRVLVVTEGRVGHRMSGTGIRYRELATSLSGESDVVLAHRGSLEVLLSGIRQLSWSETHFDHVLSEAEEADVVIVHGYVLEKVPALKYVSAPLVVDMYCPFVFENIEIHKDRGNSLTEREGIHDNDLRVWNEQLAAGDYFLAATERQRDLILGSLTTLGRVRPATCGPDTRPESFVSIVPFGLCDEPGVERDGEPAVMKGVWPGVERDDVVLLWGGGIWSWLDPLTPARAMERVAKVNPRIKLVFMSTLTAEDVIDMPVLRALRDLVENSEVLRQSVIFNDRDFIPYGERGRYFREADAGVCAHEISLESHFAFRTRILDYLSYGLPILTSSGDYFGELVSREDLGRSIAVGDVEGWAAAMLEVGEPDTRSRWRERVHEVRTRFSWENATLGLRDFVHTRGRMAALASSKTQGPGSVPSDDTTGGELSHLALRSLFEKAFEDIRRLDPHSGPIARGRRHVSRDGRSERNIDVEELLAHVQRMEMKLDLIKRIPLASTAWRAASWLARRMNRSWQPIASFDGRRDRRGRTQTFDAVRLQQIEEENRRLKDTVAQLILDLQALRNAHHSQ